MVNIRNKNSIYKNNLLAIKIKIIVYQQNNAIIFPFLFLKFNLFNFFKLLKLFSLWLNSFPVLILFEYM